MKNKLLSIISLLLILGSGVIKRTQAQVAVIGITAEVIESVSASSSALTAISPISATSNIIQTQGESSPNSLTIKFGEKTISPGDIVTVNVADNSVSFTLIQENIISMESSPGNSNNSDPQSPNWQLSQIRSSPNLNPSLPSGALKGIFTVVFACN